MKFAVVLVALVSLTGIAEAQFTNVQPTAPSVQVLPDATLTPGAINPDVTQDTINTTICVKGWTKTIRPPSSYTTNLKIQQLRALGYVDQNTRDYEEDHLISLEIGGSPTSPKNLWPEPYSGQWGARVKDKLENKLNQLVCSGQITLDEAQSAITKNWIDAYQKYVNPN